MKRLLLLMLLPAAAACGGGAAVEQSSAATFTVKRGDLRITLTESGTLEARNKVSIRPQIETGAKILTIVDEGTTVKEGDILVELDKTEIDSEIERLEDSVIQLEAELKNARTDRDITQGENESAKDKADLKLEFAKLELKRYVEGDHPQEQRKRELAIDEADSRLKQAKDKYDQMPKLFEEGFVTAVELEEKKLAFETAQVALETAKLDLSLYTTYEYPMTLRQKQSDVTEAERELTRVVAKAEASLSAAEAVVRQKERQYETAVQKLEKAQKNRENHTISAPQAGIVIYGGGRDRWGNAEDEVKVGATVFPGRTLIELPDLGLMDARLQVHQADVGKLRVGQTAWVTLPGRNQQRYEAKVSEIGSVAQSQNWRDPIRRFDVKVQIVERVEGLRAGVTVEVEVDVGAIEGVLFLPLQTVSTSGNAFTVFRREGGEARRVRVTLGQANEQFVQVLDGLAEGDEILLVNPEVVAEEEKKPEAGQEKAPNGVPAGGAGARPGGTGGGARPGGGGTGGGKSGGGGR